MVDRVLFLVVDRLPFSIVVDRTFFFAVDHTYVSTILLIKKILWYLPAFFECQPLVEALHELCRDISANT